VALLLRQKSSATVYRRKEQARYLQVPARRQLWIAPEVALRFGIADKEKDAVDHFTIFKAFPSKVDTIARKYPFSMM
jgi:hypothetical protein